jgi:hypothetical protein
MAVLRHMMRLGCLALAVFVCKAEEQARVLQPTSAPEVVAAADWAVSELQTLSASNVYTTLSLAGIDEASTSDGAYHAKTFLTLRLSSPYFKSKLPEERVKVVVMQHKTEDHKQ